MKERHKLRDFWDNKKIKPAIIDWLIKRLNIDIEYNHDLRDQWVRINVWDGQLSISFDSRNEQQNNILSKIPAEFIGCKQAGTGKLVNTNVIYFDMDKEFEIEYPAVIKKRIFRTETIRESGEPNFYSYDWECDMSDGTIMEFNNQDKNKLDIGKWILPTKIQERFLLKTLLKV